jgi:hypothetical protein
VPDAAASIGLAVDVPGLGGLKPIVRKPAFLLLVILVVLLAAFGVPLPILMRGGQQRRPLRNDYVASEIMQR